MNLERNYSHQTTFPLNTNIRFPLRDYHCMLPEECQTWKLASSYNYFYDQDMAQLSLHPDEEIHALYSTLNNAIDEHSVRENVLRELSNVFQHESTPTEEKTTAADDDEEELNEEVYIYQQMFDTIDIYERKSKPLICIWLPDQLSENENQWSQLSKLIYQWSMQPVAIMIPHHRIHYLCARLLFTVQLFYQRFRMVKLISPPQLANVDRCFLLYNSSAQQSPICSMDLNFELQKFHWLLPPSNDFLVKLEFTFFQMVANECYLNEQALSFLLSDAFDKNKFMDKTRQWLDVRRSKWEKIKGETRSVVIRDKLKNEIILKNNSETHEF